MDFDALINETTRLLKMEGWSESSPQPTLADLVNEALRIWSWEAEYMMNSFSFPTVANTSEYTLTSPPDWKLVKDASFGTINLNRGSEDQVRLRDNLWYQAASTQPDTFFIIRPNVLRLYPPPATVQTVTGYGVRADTDLALATDSPGCPAHYHRSIARLAAWLYADAYSLGEGNARIQGYYEKAMSQAVDCQLWMASQNQMGLQRTVLRRRPRTVWMNYEDVTVRSL